MTGRCVSISRCSCAFASSASSSCVVSWRIGFMARRISWMMTSAPTTSAARKNQQIDAQKLSCRLVCQTVRQLQQILPPGRAYAAKNPVIALKRRLIRIEGEGRQRNRIADAEKRRTICRKHIHGGIRDIFGQQIFPERTAVQLKRHDDGHRRQLCAADIHQDRQLAASSGKLPVINKRRFGGRTFHCRKPIFRTRWRGKSVCGGSTTPLERTHLTSGYGWIPSSTMSSG